MILPRTHITHYIIIRRASRPYTGIICCAHNRAEHTTRMYAFRIPRRARSATTGSATTLYHLTLSVTRARSLYIIFMFYGSVQCARARESCCKRLYEAVVRCCGVAAHSSYKSIYSTKYTCCSSGWTLCGAEAGEGLLI